MTSKPQAEVTMVDEAYKSHPLNFAVYGKHCFRAVKTDGVNDAVAGKIRLSRGGWTPVGTIGEARLAYIKFQKLCELEGIRPRDEPGGLGLVASDAGVITHLVYPAGVAVVTYLGKCGDRISSAPATTDLFSIAADEADEGVQYYPGASDDWAVGYQGEFRGQAPVGDSNFA